MNIHDHDDVVLALQKMMADSGAHLQGHFRLTSGLHSGHYMQCARLLCHPAYAAFVGEQIAERIKSLEPEVILAPAFGGLIVGHEVARSLDIPFYFCERDSDGIMSLRRFPMPTGKRAVVVEDVITTGLSSAEVGNLICAQGAEWVGTATVVDRSSGKHCLPTPLYSLWSVSFPVYTPDECPMCQQGLPVVKPGSR